jgi:hypothetical protein
LTCTRCAPCRSGPAPGPSTALASPPRSARRCGRTRCSASDLALTCGGADVGVRVRVPERPGEPARGDLLHVLLHAPRARSPRARAPTAARAIAPSSSSSSSTSTRHVPEHRLLGFRRAGPPAARAPAPAGTRPARAAEPAPGADTRTRCLPSPISRGPCCALVLVSVEPAGPTPCPSATVGAARSSTLGAGARRRHPLPSDRAGAELGCARPPAAGASGWADRAAVCAEAGRGRARSVSARPPSAQQLTVARRSRRGGRGGRACSGGKRRGVFLAQQERNDHSGQSSSLPLPGECAECPYDCAESPGAAVRSRAAPPRRIHPASIRTERRPRAR